MLAFGVVLEEGVCRALDLPVILDGREAVTRPLRLFAVGELTAELGTRVVCNTDLLGCMLGHPVCVGVFVGTFILIGLVVVLLFTDWVSK